MSTIRRIRILGLVGCLLLLGSVAAADAAKNNRRPRPAREVFAGYSGLEASFRADGVEIVRGNETGTSWALHLTPRQGGYLESSAEGQTVTYQRDGLTERWEDTAQGLLIRLSLAAGGSSDPVEAMFDLETELEVIVATDGREVSFYDDGARVARLAVLGSRGRLSFEDRLLRMSGRGVMEVVLAASSSATRLGLSLTPDWINDGLVAGERFAHTVAPAGDVNGDGFGDVIVGASQCPELPPGAFCQDTLPGRALLYFGEASGLSTTVGWEDGGGAPQDQFGYSVATAGDVNGDGYGDVVVGAPGFATDTGQVLLYLGSASGPSTSPAVIAAPAGSADPRFGHTVATAGDVNGDGFSDVIIGGVNVAFVYLGCDDRQPLSACNGGLSPLPAWDTGTQVTGDWGVSVATAGDVDGDTFSDVIVSGFDAAFLYRGSASGLELMPAWSVDISFLVTSDGTSNRQRFLSSVATAGDVNGDGYSDVIVGSPHRDDRELGTASIYLGSPTGLITTPAWKAEGLGQFAASVAPAGDVDGDGLGDVIIGAPEFKVADVGFDAGKAAVYFGANLNLSSTGLTTTTLDDADWTVSAEITNARLGTQIATAGDVDGDGFSDVVVGSPGLVPVGTPLVARAQGRAYVYLGASFGPAGGPITDPCLDQVCPPGETGDDAEWDFRGTQIDEQLGSSVAMVGDVNADGFGDVIVGAPLYDGTESNQGRVLLFLGSASGLSTTFDTEIVGDRIDGKFGTSVAAAGDVNGDGFGDVIVDGTLHLGSDMGFVAPPTPWIAGADALGVGDVNGDGFDDVLAAESSRAALYVGSASGLSTTPVWRERGLAHSRWNSAGDVNGDGFGDVFVHCCSPINSPSLYLGSAGGLSPAPSWSGDPNASSTTALSSNGPIAAGDVNGDGFSDVILGHEFATFGGNVFLFFGSASGLSAAPLASRPDADWAATFEPVRRQFLGADFGNAVASGGDVNGDGFSDVIVGARGSANQPQVIGVWNQGRVFLFSGGGSGPAIRVRQLQADLMADEPIAPGGASDSASAFRLKVAGRNPGGGKVGMGLAWEVARLPDLVAGSDIRRTSLAGTCDGGTACTNNVDCPGGEICRLDSSGFCDDGATTCTLSTQDTDCGGIGSGACRIELSARVQIPGGGSGPAGFYRWRARIITDSPFFPGSPWVSLPGESITEKKLRNFGNLQPASFGLHGPPTNERQLANAGPLTFSWRTGGATRFSLEWSRNPHFVAPMVSIEVQTLDPAWTSLQPDDTLWRSILDLVQSTGFQPDPVFWRVVPLDGSGTGEVRALRFPVVQPPLVLGPVDGAGAIEGFFPVFSWEANHNERYEIRFSTNTHIGEPRVTVGGTLPDGFFNATCIPRRAPLELEEECTFDLPAEDWVEIVELSKLNGGIVYYVLFAKDALDRLSFGRVRSLRIQTALPSTPWDDLKGSRRREPRER